MDSSPADSGETERAQRRSRSRRRLLTARPRGASARGARTWARREDGQAIVEMALSIPILLLLLTAIIQFGMVFTTYTNLTDAARTGARELALQRGVSDPCDPAVSQTITSTVGQVNTANMTVTPSFPGNASTDFCGSSGGTACSYAYSPSGSTCSTNGNETQGDQAQITVTYPYTVTIFGMGLLHLTLTAASSDAIE